jgi:hypothetical protein
MARALVFSTVRLPDALRCVYTRYADTKQRTSCAPSPHKDGARSVPTRAAPHRRAGMVPRRHHRLGAHRRSPLELLVQPYLHTLIPWPSIPTKTPNTPAPISPPASIPTTYCRRRAPEQPAEAARRSLAADCESAGSTQCLLAGATWCQRWQPALATCVHAPAPPETPQSARSERAVAAAADTGRRPLARSRAGKTSSWVVQEEMGCEDGCR